MIEQVKVLLNQFAPQIVESLLPPVIPQKIEELRSVVGRPIPDDLVALYSETAGNNSECFANFAFGLVFTDIESAITKFRNDLGSESFQFADPGIKKNGFALGSRFEIGNDSAHCSIYVDLDPDSGGTYGQVVFVDSEMNVALFLAKSIREYIEKFEKQLSEGMYTLQEDALADGVQWLDPERSIDVGNWYNSPTWKYVGI